VLSGMSSGTRPADGWTMRYSASGPHRALIPATRTSTERALAARLAELAGKREKLMDLAFDGLFGNGEIARRAAALDEEAASVERLLQHARDTAGAEGNGTGVGCGHGSSGNSSGVLSNTIPAGRRVSARVGL
jgi:hypothetical protein